MRARLIHAPWLALAVSSCQQATSPGPSDTARTASAAAPIPKIVVDTERGGLIYDNWTQDHGIKSGAELPALPRLKDVYGWDLRGAEGLYGAAYAAKQGVGARNWLTSKESHAEIVELLRSGDPKGAAKANYGVVLDESALWSTAAFIADVRDGNLPRPDQIWTLSAGTPGTYRLNAGADLANGHALVLARCSRCHGDDGTEELFDGGTYSLGSHARQKAYEGWAKLVSGHPGSAMGRQLTGDGTAMAKEALDMLAALCDRAHYPLGAATGNDVPDGDPRCGEYLR